MQGGPALTQKGALPLRVASLHYEVGPAHESLGSVDSELMPPATLLVMPYSSLYLEFDNPTAVARARLWPSWARLYPSLHPDRWYRVWGVGQDAGGMFLDAGRPLHAFRDHLQIEQMSG